jgi:hypothetical protein
MHIHTGSVDSKDNWDDEDFEINYKDGSLVEVVKNDPSDSEYDKGYGDYRPA